jgi:hypothetical protein
LLVVLASGLSSDVEDFDKLLFGYRLAHIGWDRKETHQSFEATGILATRSLENTYSAVLAIVGLSPFGVKSASLFVHPHFAGLPSSFSAFQQCRLVADGIQVLPATLPDPFGALNFARME